jgi:hypothetical protein
LVSPGYVRRSLRRGLDLFIVKNNNTSGIETQKMLDIIGGIKPQEPFGKKNRATRYRDQKLLATEKGYYVEEIEWPVH